MRMGFFAQDSYAVRCDWGLAGANASTADVTIAVERGIKVYP